MSSQTGDELKHSKPRRVGITGIEDISVEPLRATYRTPHDKQSERSLPRVLSTDRSVQKAMSVSEQ